MVTAMFNAVGWAAEVIPSVNKLCSVNVYICTFGDWKCGLVK